MRRRALPTLATLLGAGVIALLAYGVASQAPSRTLDDLVRRHTYPPAPGSSRALPVLSGGSRRTLASLRGRVVVVNFWASWCAPCQTEAPILERAQQTLAARGGTVLGVAFKDSATDARAFVARYHLTYPNVRDEDGSFASSYGTDQLPESFVLDRRGRVVAISRGEIDQAFLDRALALAGRV